MLKFLMKSQIKSSQVTQKQGGFTLIELLVAAVIASLIITPLLGFMVNVVNRDSREQAKSNSEQEIQTALNYISRDLRQAIYVYDSAGVNEIRTQLPYANDNTKLPVLVFWKRDLVRDVVPTATNNSRDDAFVYSLVAYYLIKDNNNVWSRASRIGRWSIRDGVAARSGGVSCPGYDANVLYVALNHCPDPGFASFTEQLEEVGTLEQAMNRWVKHPTPYTNPLTVLTDYIDQTPNPVGAAATCPAGFDNAPVTPGNMTGFYACVDVESVTAQVFIRGNAMARIRDNNIDYVAANRTYFPTSSVRIQGRGFLFR
ncbi:hormogonium polysaccharide secretion pseudopilin HpsC [Nodularia chucula]|uniref:hormogonium polysaccharide secretion pseudopilin HpsC n=1 Tax=Nodularia chucula TaxID=3093667 RepID=UPI0039C7340C